VKGHEVFRLKIQTTPKLDLPIKLAVYCSCS